MATTNLNYNHHHHYNQQYNFDTINDNNIDYSAHTNSTQNHMPPSLAPKSFALACHSSYSASHLSAYHLDEPASGYSVAYPNKKQHQGSSMVKGELESSLNEQSADQGPKLMIDRFLDLGDHHQSGHNLNYQLVGCSRLAANGQPDTIHHLPGAPRWAPAQSSSSPRSASSESIVTASLQSGAVVYNQQQQQQLYDNNELTSMVIGRYDPLKLASFSLSLISFEKLYASVD